MTLTEYALSASVAGPFTGVPSTNENFDPLQGSVAVKPSVVQCYRAAVLGFIAAATVVSGVTAVDLVI